MELHGIGHIKLFELKSFSTVKAKILDGRHINHSVETVTAGELTGESSLSGSSARTFLMAPFATFSSAHPFFSCFVL